MGKSAKKFLKSFGSKVSAKEVKRAVKKFDAKPSKIKSYVKSTPGVSFSSSGRRAVKSYSSPSRTKTTNTLPGGGGDTTFDWPGYYDKVLAGDLARIDREGYWSSEVATIGANAEVSSAGIRASADRYIADITSSRDLEGTKYVADKESEWRQAVANIEVKGRLDLQPIINAGLEKVAGIEAQAQRDVAETTGKYNVEGVRVRGEADKRIGQMQLAGNMYNLINSVFG